jgi:hypothetical protein
MKNLILALSLMSCSGSREICKTKCGVSFYGQIKTQDTIGDNTCAELQRIEDLTMSVYSDIVTDPRFNVKNMCQSLNGYSLWTNPESHWIDGWNRDIAGMTECDTKIIEINNSPFNLSSIHHEFAHVIQNCEAVLPITDGEDIDHADWTRDFINKGIDQLYGE